MARRDMKELGSVLGTVRKRSLWPRCRVQKGEKKPIIEDLNSILFLIKMIPQD